MKEMAIVNRIAKLEGRENANTGIINKLKRKLRRLRKEDD